MSENFQENTKIERRNSRECGFACDECKNLCACAVCDAPVCDECVCAVCNAPCGECECSICEKETCVGCPSAPIKTLKEQEVELIQVAEKDKTSEKAKASVTEGQISMDEIVAEISDELVIEEVCAELEAEKAEEITFAPVQEVKLSDLENTQAEQFEEVEEVACTETTSDQPDFTVEAIPVEADEEYLPVEEATLTDSTVEEVVEEVPIPTEEVVEEAFEEAPVPTEEVVEEVVEEVPVPTEEVVEEVVEEASIPTDEVVEEVVEEVPVPTEEVVEEVVEEAPVPTEEVVEEVVEEVPVPTEEVVEETPVEPEKCEKKAVSDTDTTEEKVDNKAEEEGEDEGQDVSPEEEAMLNEEDEPDEPDPEEASKEERKRMVEELKPQLAVPPRRRYIPAPSEKAFVDDEYTVEVLTKSEMKENVQSVFKALIKEGIKLGYLDKYDGLSASEIKEEYEGELIYEVADQELRKVALKICQVKKETKVGVYAFSWDGTDVHHLGYLNEPEKAEALIPYIEDKDNYVFNVCGIITGGKFKSVEKDPKTEKIKIKNCEGLPYGIELDIAIYKKLN